MLLQEGHNAVVRNIKFADNNTHVFASASDDGSIRFWDMRNFLVINKIKSNKGGSPLTLQIKDDIMLSGWVDGALRMHMIDNEGKQVWELANTHKGGVTSLELTADSKFIATGGAEG